MRKWLKLYFVMGSRDCRKYPPVEVLRRAIAGGITCFQFREKHSGLTMAETIELGRRLREQCQKAGIPFFVNDRVDLAMVLGADGVHVGQEDLPLKEVRKLAGSQMKIGVSANTPKQAEQAIADGADYIGIGPIFPARSKDDAKRTIHPDGLSAFARFQETVPLVAIGGISEHSAADVVSAGVDGVAVISAIAAQKHPEKAAATLKNAVDSGVR